VKLWKDKKKFSSGEAFDVEGRPDERGDTPRADDVGPKRHLYAVKQEEGRSRPNSRLISLHDLRSPITEHYRKLYTKLLFVARERSYKTIAVTSATMGEGKTLTSLNLALIMAQDLEQNILIADCDLRRPMVDQTLGLSPRHGIADVIQGKVDIRSAILKIPSANLYVLPAGGPPENPAEILVAKEMRPLIERLRNRFDFVIIDTPPVVPLADQNFLSELVDGFILVVRAGKTPRDIVIAALESINTDNILGIVFNGVDKSISSNYYYGYYSKSSK